MNLPDVIGSESSSSTFSDEAKILAAGARSVVFCFVIVLESIPHGTRKCPLSFEPEKN